MHPAQSNERDRGLAGALLVLAACMCSFHVTSREASRDSALCSSPVEVSAHKGWTTHVACAENGHTKASLRGPARLLFGLTLDLNVADVAALEVLPRIGPRRAAAIVATREEERFASMDDLARVPGIGPRTLEGLAGWASVEGKP
jgi:hypothetical protein